MNCATLILAYLMVGSLPSVLGIVCKKCTPSVSPLVRCNLPSEIKEVNCDNEAAPAPNVTFDACTSGKAVASIGGTAYVYECTVKNSSDPSIFNCTTTQERICSDAQSRLPSLSVKITINSCQARCCDTNNCNVQELIDQPPATEGSTTVGSTTVGPTTEALTSVGPTAESGVGKIQSLPLLVSFLIFLTFCWFKQLE